VQENPKDGKAEKDPGRREISEKQDQHADNQANAEGDEELTGPGITLSSISDVSR
jgi:hypothetical protein